MFFPCFIFSNCVTHSYGVPLSPPNEKQPPHKPPIPARAAMATPDPMLPLFNLSILGQKMESLRQFISDSVSTNTSISADDLQTISTEIASTIRHTILNGAALIASSQPQNPHPPMSRDPSDLPPDPSDPIDLAEEDDDLDCEIIEIDAAELLAQQPHCCEICGKGFKRDANLRMHMRAHGNQFKTLEALLKPPGNEINSSAGRVIRFSCPFAGCNRNRAHQRFRPLKTMPCVKNHFKRSHCPKTYSCSRCNKRSFSVVADLRSHIRHCGDCRWLCSCGTKFSRKDKLLGHVALFEGHMVVEAEDEEKGKGVVFGEGGARAGAEAAGEAFDLEFFEGMEGIEGIFRE